MFKQDDELDYEESDGPCVQPPETPQAVERQKSPIIIDIIEIADETRDAADNARDSEDSEVLFIAATTPPTTPPTSPLYTPQVVKTPMKKSAGKTLVAADFIGVVSILFSREVMFTMDRQFDFCSIIFAGRNV